MDDHPKSDQPCSETSLSLTVGRSKELSEVLKELQLSIADAMSNLFDLEKATINRQKDDPIPDSQELRDALHEYWRQITKMLQTARLLGGDFKLIRSRLIAGASAEFPGLLEDLSDLITKVGSLTLELIQSYEGPTTVYDDLWRSPGETIHEYDGEVINGKRYPNGCKALNGYKKSNDRILWSLKDLDDIWKKHSEFCNNCVEALVNKQDKTDQIVDALDLSHKWIGYQKDIEQAMREIGNVCDVICIKATGGPSRTFAHSSGDKQRQQDEIPLTNEEKPMWSLGFVDSTTRVLGRNLKNLTAGIKEVITPNVTGSTGVEYTHDECGRLSEYGGLEERSVFRDRGILPPEPYTGPVQETHNQMHMVYEHYNHNSLQMCY